MANKRDRTLWLQQIPVFELRDQVKSLLDSDEMITQVRERIQDVLEHSIRDAKNTIERMPREQLVTLINECPEIKNDTVEDRYYEYRYGANPSLYIYLYTPSGTKPADIPEIRLDLEKHITGYNIQENAQTHPRTRNVRLDRLFQLPDHPEVVEGNYSFHRRIDLVDENRQPNSVYETVYGFFWLNLENEYVVIQARDHSILQYLEGVIETSARIHLTNLFITKELKNAMPYLLEESLYYIKLHDPNPKSKRVCWVSMTDDELYHKGYKNWEERYPVISSARYKIDFGDTEQRSQARPPNLSPGRTLERSLKIDFENGEMSFAGRLTATQLIEWSLDFLSEIVDTIRGFERKPGEYIKTDRFTAVKELRKYDPLQRETITRLIAQILELKDNSEKGTLDIGMSPLELAEIMGRLVTVRFRVACQDDACSKVGYLTCPIEGENVFRVLEEAGKWKIECAIGRKNHWSVQLPISAKCESNHPLKITARDLEQWIEILPGQELLNTVADIINDYIPRQSFSREMEFFMINKRNLIYYEDKGEVPSEAITVIRISARDIHRGAVVGGVLNVSPAKSKKAKSTKKPAGHGQPKKRLQAASKKKKSKRK